jgi:hypothetical protein
MDEALTAVAEEDAEHMELYTQNVAARTAVERERRVAAKSGNGHAPAKAALPGAQRANLHQANGHDVPQPDGAPPIGEQSEPISPLV